MGKGRKTGYQKTERGKGRVWGRKNRMEKENGRREGRVGRWQ